MISFDNRHDCQMIAEKQQCQLTQDSDGIPVMVDIGICGTKKSPGKPGAFSSNQAMDQVPTPVLDLLQGAVFAYVQVIEVLFAPNPDGVRVKTQSATAGVPVSVNTPPV